MRSDWGGDTLRPNSLALHSPVTLEFTVLRFQGYGNASLLPSILLSCSPNTEVSRGGFALDIDEIEEGIKTAAQVTQLAKTTGPGLITSFKRWRASKRNDGQAHLEIARSLLRENARDMVTTLSLTTEAAFHILGPDFDTENVLDPTWQKRWTQGAAKWLLKMKNESSGESRLLAGEIQSPGRYSLRTLNIMDTLSPTEANLFRRLCSCVWRNDENSLISIMPHAKDAKIWNMTEKQATTLEEAGLIFLPSLGYHLQLTKDLHYRIECNGELHLLFVPTAATNWKISTTELTTSGREIFDLVEVTPDPVYQREVIRELKKHANVFHAIGNPQGWTIGARWRSSLTRLVKLDLRIWVTSVPLLDNNPVG